MQKIHRSRTLRGALAAAAALTLSPYAVLSAGAQEAPPAVAAAEPSAPAPLRAGTTGHVVVISVDGLRPDAIWKFGARTLQRLMTEGSYTLNASTIDPSLTLPSHTSMLTGEEPERHGIEFNRNHVDDHGLVSVPTVFARARENGFQTAAFFSKGKFRHLVLPGSLNWSVAPEGNSHWSASRTVWNMERYLEAGNKPNLMFVHIGEPDYAGHVFGWMSWFYGRGVRMADDAVSRVLDAADRAFGEGSYAVVVTADHGGHGWGHGSADPQDVTIPWIAWGEGVKAGTRLPDGIRTMDTAATALWLLGMDGIGVGTPVLAAFDAPAAGPLHAAVTAPAAP
jgi:Type I phosphodiesterase / nucleotide pyrophosphatase